MLKNILYRIHFMVKTYKQNLSRHNVGLRCICMSCIFIAGMTFADVTTGLLVSQEHSSCRN